MTRPTAVRRAPGKLFIAGEYAVVQPGTPALLVAVDRHVTATAAHPGPGEAAEVTIHSDLCPRPARLYRTPDGLAPRDEGDEHLARTSLTHVLAAIGIAGELAAERGRTPPPVRVSVRSGLHSEGTKYGLGSSGAVTVATIDAVARHYGLDLTPEARYRLAMLATARLDPKASGGDLAASTFGGWIAYRAPDRPAILDLARRRGVEGALRAPWPGFELRRLPSPHRLSLQVGWTGTPVSTGALVSRLDPGDSAYQDFLTRSTTCVNAAADALRQGDDQALLHQIGHARHLLAHLDDKAGLGIFTDRLTTLCDAAEALGGAAKPSGAGGGDCGIALMRADAQPALTRLRERWTAAGIVPLDLRATDPRTTERTEPAR